MIDSQSYLTESKKRFALWKAKKEVIRWIDLEIFLTMSKEDKTNKESDELYIESLKLLIEEVFNAITPPWET